MQFNNKVIIVTGGVSGVGRSVSKMLASQGASLAINYSDDDEQAAKLRMELAISNTAAFTLKGHVNDADDMKALIHRTIDEFGERIDGLVNIVDGPIHRKICNEENETFYNKFVRLNLNPTFYCTQMVLPLMTDGASIVNFVSQSDYANEDGSASSYAASKVAIINFTRRIAKEVQSYGVRINSFCPGTISVARQQACSTPQPHNRGVNTVSTVDKAPAANKVPTADKEPTIEQITTPEVSKIVEFLLSKKASRLNGANLDIHNGNLFYLADQPTSECSATPIYRDHIAFKTAISR